MEIVLGLLAVGCLASLFVLRLPARGTLALGVDAVPPLGYVLAGWFC